MTESEVFEAVTGSGSSDFALLIGILNQHGPWWLKVATALGSVKTLTTGRYRSRFCKDIDNGSLPLPVL